MSPTRTTGYGDISNVGYELGGLEVARLVPQRRAAEGLQVRVDEPEGTPTLGDVDRRPPPLHEHVQPQQVHREGRLVGEVERPGVRHSHALQRVVAHQDQVVVGERARERRGDRNGDRDGCAGEVRVPGEHRVRLALGRECVEQDLLEVERQGYGPVTTGSGPLEVWTKAHGAVSHRATSLSPRTSGASSATSSAIASARCGKSVRSTSA